MSFRRTATLLAGLIAGVAVLSGCGGASGRGASRACGPVIHEAFDTRSLQHVLPNASVPNYLTDPPTSGPHQPSPPISGAVSEPLPKPVQVGILEGGNVLVQYNGLSASGRRALSAIVGPKIVLAPNPDIAAGHVVITAWLYKQSCSAPDPAAVRAFVKARANHGPDYHAAN
ncbi:MAG: DUF3105 domain-containing protein [Acidimicrobiales bacterium]